MNSVTINTLLLMSRDNECVSVSRLDSIICEPLQYILWFYQGSLYNC